ncbi:threonine-phosphate decarboxylase [Massilia sp. Dwa41.01b]|uniref:threonine-phosphate decarboxylase CobD n=1 Tax=Massilia sp. Dwa41.01b TaxID=2709302 RepID=UPI0015FED073|nr:threonine-phosphate decarboxylase CobD [Massilia sp. Dwa41.01b]QNA90954.1 threonine-phosphate decarboxylase [Massilia sp. Dwa41.01b]
MLEHGGNLREAMRLHPRSDWIDLSTGINPRGYPVAPPSPSAWHRLPEADPALVRAACRYYGAVDMLPVAGTQAAIQALPRLRVHSRVTVSAPSYAEHAHHWSRHGHTLRQVNYAHLGEAVDSSDVLVVCNPNNPTGETVAPEQLREWAARLQRRGGWLVVDEAFGDTQPEGSVAALAYQPGLIVLRSIGKFFGLAGLRLGFVAAERALLGELADLLGPRAVSGPAQSIALQALDDEAWQATMRARLATAGGLMRELLRSHGIEAAGTDLFYYWPEARPEAFHAHLAERGIWCRLFRDAARGIRLGLPANEDEWLRLARALDEWSYP